MLQVTFKQYVNQELPHVPAVFIKDRRTRGQIANIYSIMEKAREFQKQTSTFASLNTLKPLTCMDHNKLWKILKEMGVPDHLTYLLRNLYAGQEATVRTRHETIDWFKIEKGTWKSCILSPCLFNFYPEYIIGNAGLDESQAEIETSRRNIYNLRYADDSSIMAEDKEELKKLLLKMEGESQKAGLKGNIKQTKIMASVPITSWQINGEKVEAVKDFVYLGF